METKGIIWGNIRVILSRGYLGIVGLYGVM